LSERGPVTLQVNGAEVEVTVSTADTLLDTLRDQLELYSVRGACGIGICGTCTVLVDGAPISSCLSLAVLNEGRSIVTSEGLGGSPDHFDRVQEAFVRENAFQCSYCIPAMVLGARAYLDDAERPTLEGAKEALAGNLCRCGSYPQIIDALRALIADETAP
jgi:aerobic-type carbon monoxide dehydrogenase small subunit (CoxS/CutS family)